MQFKLCMQDTNDVVTIIEKTLSLFLAKSNEQLLACI